MNNKQLLIIVLLIISLIIISYFFVNLFSYFFCFSIFFCCLFFVGAIYIEKVTDGDYLKGKFPTLGTIDLNRERFKFYDFWIKAIGIALLIFIYVASVIVLKEFQQPGEAKPYFNNADHQAIKNSGVAFNETLVLSTNEIQGTANGLKSNESGTFKARQTDNGTFSLNFNHYFEPVFLQKEVDGDFTPVNNVFQTPIGKSFLISNDSISIYCRDTIIYKKEFFWENPYNYYNISIRCDAKSVLRQLNITTNYKDFILIPKKTIEKGKSFYSVFIESKEFESGKAQSKQVLERILQSTGEVYFLANTDGTSEEKWLTIFPTADFFKNNFLLEIDGTPQSPALQSTVNVKSEDRFFIGFYNSRQQLFFSTIDKNLYPNSKKAAVLNFDFPKYFTLSSQKNASEIGTKQIRFLSNHYTQLLNSALKEGFLFHEDLRNARSNVFSGTMIYTLNPSGVGFSGELTDNLKNDQKGEPIGSYFLLDSQNHNYEWLFHVRDFSDNGFSFTHNLFYLSVLFLLFAFTLLAHSHHRFERIEASIYAVLYTLLTYRLLLLWRVATFPPLEKINKHELENTLIKYDFNFIGKTLPVPLTFLLPVIFLILLNIYRYKKDAIHEMLAGPKFSSGKYLCIHSIILIICACLVKFTNLDLILRFVGVYIPLLFYLLFTVRINQQTDREAFVPRHFRFRPINYLHQFTHYLTANSEFYLTLVTFLFFMVSDRGFGILFLLFLLLKNIFINFLRKPYSKEAGTRWDMLRKPSNYWIYGIISLFIYLLLLVYKPLFHKILIHWDAITVSFILIFCVYLAIVKSKKKYWFWIPGACIIVALMVPSWKGWIDKKIDNQLKNVIHRASLIYQPVDDLITENDYDSFRERKIVETAEGQWFINNYLNKSRNVSNRIDFKSHFNRGVNYPTQTRDVVVPRFIIAEFGDWIIVWILALLALPMVFYMISNSLYRKGTHGEISLSIPSYIGSISLILVFTLGFFVWLASTNRFVFFGQDFPFLSLTSKLSLLLPLTLFFIPLLSTPNERKIERIELKTDFARIGIFFLAIILFLVASGKSNNLQETNFQISLKKTEETINVKLNTLLNNIQDTLVIDNRAIHNKGDKIPQDLSRILSILGESKDYKTLIEESDTYSRSILEILQKNPAMALRQDSPVYLRFDDNRYQSVYNKHLYLELPPYEDQTAWRGNLYQESLDSMHYPVLRIYNKPIVGRKMPFFAGSEGGTLKVAVLPNSWFANEPEPVALMNLENDVNRTPSMIDLISNKKEEILNQKINGFVSKLGLNELARVSEGENHFLVSYTKDNNYAFMSNYWVNGRQRMVYPMAEKLFWVYHYANAIKTAYDSDNLLEKNATITLDYDLNKRVGDTLVYAFNKKFNNTPNFKFAVIAADGDGKIRLMQDYVKNRTIIDPNNDVAIDKMNQRYFFFSNNKNERDQWGNTNLLHLSYGPGSSIKPLVFASLASRLNVGWENLIVAKPPGGFERIDGQGKVSIGQYAGYKLPKKKGWLDEHGELYGDIDAVGYLRTSSNFYHSVLMFLGSYHRNDFRMNDKYQIQSVLSRELNDSDNQFPALKIGGVDYRLKSFKNKGWPKSSKDEASYFGSEKSLLAEGLDKNLGLIVGDIDKTDFIIKDRARVNYADTMVYQTLNKQQIGGFLWSFPEQSFFIQAERKHLNPMTNFFNGLKNPTLGGTPYNITPLKMTEMYGKMFSQNKDYQLYLTGRRIEYSPWKLDSTTWKNGFEDFMKNYVVKGMEQVMMGRGGTASALFNGRNVYNYQGKEYYFYGKTGTIKEGEQNDSKRLVLVITRNNLMQTPIKGTKFYTVYFTANESENQDWNTYRVIINQILASDSFKKYMGE